VNRQESAEVTALQALSWVAGDPDRLGAFLNMTGAAPGDLAKHAGEPAFLGSVLDFLLSEDALVTGFCDSQNLPYDTPMRARAELPGGAQWHWT
jgi:hypothetical protein